MRRTRIKFCGITRLEDAMHAAELGVDAIGMVFTERSPRFIEPDAAAAIARQLPPLMGTVALFMDDDADRVRAVERLVRPALLQFHGSETDAFCAAFDTPFIKAVAMNGADGPPDLGAWPHAAGLLLDGHVPGGQGGQGTTFDWSGIPADMAQSVVLAGGLDAGNVAAAIQQVKPWAVDVSSGIEVSPGVKDCAKMRAFVAAVQSARE